MSDFEDLTPDWLPLRDAVARVMAAAAPGAPVRVSLADALHRVTAEAVTAAVTMPPADNSAMDGYAVRGDDARGATAAAPVRLDVIGVSRAGGPVPPPVAQGRAVRIMTGARIPAGADTVIRVEDTDAERSAEGTVTISSDRDLGRHLRPAGEDFAAGDEVVPAGTLLTAGWLALLVSAGGGEVGVVPAPRVALLTTGDELRPAGDIDQVLEGTAIPDSNGPMLAALARGAGAEPVTCATARDEPDDVRRAVAEAGQADVLVTVGGASMGEADLLKRVLIADGFRLDFWRAKIRPGSPVSFGWLPRADRPDLPIFSLPGNPASAFVTFHVFVRPFLRRLAGDPRPFHRVRAVETLDDLTGTGSLCHFHRVRFADSDEASVRLTGAQGSGLVSSLGKADALAVVPDGIRSIRAGEGVEILCLEEGLAGRAEPGYVDNAGQP